MYFLDKKDTHKKTFFNSLWSEQSSAIAKAVDRAIDWTLKCGKCALIDLFGHMGAAQQAVNTILT